MTAEEIDSELEEHKEGARELIEDAAYRVTGKTGLLKKSKQNSTLLRGADEDEYFLETAKRYLELGYNEDVFTTSLEKESVAGACAYLASVMHDERADQEEIGEVIGCSPNTISTYYRQLFEAMDR